MSRSLPQPGRRGEGWVALQVVLLAAIAAAGTRDSRWPSLARNLPMGAAAVGTLGGAYLFAGAARRLGKQITPFPMPIEEGSVERSGASGLVRHPVYGGVLPVALG
jgi:protein-S-isoprenylcysteine O-methyltransferase Ste14